MRYQLVKRTLLGISLSITVCMSPAFAEKAVIAGLDKVTVTGEKVEKSLKDTTSSVSIISEDELGNTQHLNMNSAVAGVANVVVLAGQQPNIRGVSGNGSAGGFNGISGGSKPRVSMLVDGVAEPFMADLTGDSGIWDIEQVEVYRGPQSTLHGRNSIGGLVFIKTKDPSFDWHGAGRIGYRNQAGLLDTAGVISGPVIDNHLAFRLTAQKLDGDTYDKEFEYPDNPASYDLNALASTRLRGKLLWQPDFIQGLSALFTHSDTDEKGNIGRQFYRIDNPWDFISVIERNLKTDSKVSSLTVDYDIGQDTSFHLLAANTRYHFGFTSYREQANRQQVMRLNEDSKNFDGRLNFGLTSKALHGFIGFAYYDRQQDYRSFAPFSYFGDDKSDSKAIYGEASYTFIPQWTISLGGRIERENQLRDFTRLDKNGSPRKSALDTEKTLKLPKLAVQYNINKDTSTFISLRRGYNAGGGALVWSTGEYYYFDAETVNTFETGLRSSFDQGLGSLSSNLFYNRYNDYQAVSSLGKISNIHRVNSYGLELEADYTLAHNLLVKTAIGLLKTKIKDTTEQYKNINGNELSLAPRITASLGINYWLTHALQLGIKSRYAGKYFGEFTNRDDHIAGDYTLTNMNISYQINRWQVDAFINNISDEHKLTYRGTKSKRLPHGRAGIVEPRTIGASVTCRF